MENTNELYHHGRLGQKWGKRNGPPYPLDYKKLSYAEREAAKGKAVATGNIKEAASNMDFFTNDELRKVRDRFKLNQEIAGLNASTIKTGKQKINDVIEWASTAGKAVDRGVEWWNRSAKIANAFQKEEDKMLPIIGEKKQRKNKAEGKSKAELLKMLQNPNMSTKDYEDIKNRMNMIKDTEDTFRSNNISFDTLVATYEDPKKYAKMSKAQQQEAQNMIKAMNLITNSAVLRNESEKRAEEARKKKEAESIEYYI